MALLAAAALGLATPIGLAYAATLQQLQQEELQAQQQLAEEQAAYNQTQASINQTTAEINALNQSLASAQAQIGATQQQIQTANQNIQTTQQLLASTQNQLTQTEAELAATQADYQKTTVLLAETRQSVVQHVHLLSGQLQLIEERGSVGYLDVVLGARSFADFISRMELLGQIAASAAHQVQLIKAEEAAQALEQANLARETAFLGQAKNSIVQHQALLQAEESLLNREKLHALSLESLAEQQAQNVSSNLAQRQVLMNQLQQQRDQLAQGMASLQSQINYIVSQIQSLLGQYNGGYLSRQQLFQAMLPLVTPVANTYGISPALIIAVITQESGGNANALSGAGAIGLMQIMPQTAVYIASQLKLPTSQIDQELEQPTTNVEMGTWYLSQLLNTFNGNTELALAAYNAGPGAVQYLTNHYGNSFGAIEPYLPAQTQNYVPDVMSLYNLYSGWLATGG